MSNYHTQDLTSFLYSHMTPYKSFAFQDTMPNMCLYFNKHIILVSSLLHMKTDTTYMYPNKMGNQIQIKWKPWDQETELKHKKTHNLLLWNDVVLLLILAICLLVSSIWYCWSVYHLCWHTKLWVSTWKRRKNFAKRTLASKRLRPICISITL